MTDRDHVLVVVDDREIRQLTATYLENHGIRASTAADGDAMARALAAGDVDLLVLDLMLPGDDGLALCRALRERSSLPVIMVSAKAEDTERIVGIEVGADDYLGKPFNPRELLARIRALLRRSRAPFDPPVARAPRALAFGGGWTLDLPRRELRSPRGVDVPLGAAEFRLLKALLEHPHRVLTRDQLTDLSAGRDAMPFDRSIDVQVSRLRARLVDRGRDPAIIKTVRNEGYLLACEVTPIS